MNQQQKLDFISKHLFYELRMLLGAKKVLEVFDENEMGNICSLVRDSIYLHARNLYNFFSGKARNDASIGIFSDHEYNLGLYETYGDELHEAALHIKPQRIIESASSGNKLLADVAVLFAEDIERLWQDWIANEKDQEIKDQLIETLAKARQESDDDEQKVVDLFGKK